jgi:hypothetical protein
MWNLACSIQTHSTGGVEGSVVVNGLEVAEKQWCDEISAIQ